jgi:hypothetical protein
LTGAGTDIAGGLLAVSGAGSTPINPLWQSEQWRAVDLRRRALDHDDRPECSAALMPGAGLEPARTEGDLTF